MFTLIDTYSPAFVDTLAVSLVRTWTNGRFHAEVVTLAGRSVR